MMSAFSKGKLNSLFRPRIGMMAWVTQGLTKVLPQPDEKYKETVDDREEHTEVSHKDFLCLSGQWIKTFSDRQ